MVVVVAGIIQPVHIIHLLKVGMNSMMNMFEN
ncbi:unnamed protein product [Trichobilharzia regenti]|nr:unnamed protein product [Trichobilharzia regenti]